MRRILRWAFGDSTQPDVVAALLAIDIVWNLVVPADKLREHDDRIGIQPALRPWLLPIKFAALAGYLLGRKWPKLGALTATATTVYFVGATGYHVRAKDSAVGTSPAVVYLGASTRSLDVPCAGAGQLTASRASERAFVRYP